MPIISLSGKIILVKIIREITKTGVGIGRLGEQNRDTEPIATSILIDSEAGTFLDIYEKQVEAAERLLGPLYHFVKELEYLKLGINQHLQISGGEAINLCNEMDISLVDGAFLIIQEPVTYEKYVKSGEQLELIGTGQKEFHDIVRFDNMKLRANTETEFVEVEIEIMEAATISDPLSGRSGVNRLVVNPKCHSVALLDIDTPQLIIR